MGLYQVATPEAGHNGTVGGVLFANGAATVDELVNPSELAYFRGAGYGVTEVEPEAAAKTPRKTPAKPAAKQEPADPKTPEAKTPGDDTKEGADQ